MSGLTLVCRGLLAILYVLLSHFAIALESGAVAPVHITISQTASKDINHEDYYFTQLLLLALAKTERQYGKVKLVELPSRRVDKRLRAELLAGKIDVLWSPTSAELEAELLPVRVSLLKELNNYRLLLIRPESQAQFSRVQTLNDLRQFKGGIGAQWVDADIMEANSLPVVRAVGYGKLFKMLAAKRFDYFSRGLYQIQTEVNFYPDLNLAIEQELMLHYQNHVYFFVSKHNQALAERLSLGLELAQSDGSFDALFTRIPRYHWGLQQLQRQRRIIHLLPIQEPALHSKSVITP